MTMTSIFDLSPLVASIPMDAFPAWLVRVTLVAALACAFLLLARRALPATRHMVAVASLGAVAVIPLAAALLPALPVKILPARVTTETKWSEAAVSPEKDAQAARISYETAPAIDAATPPAEASPSVPVTSMAASLLDRIPTVLAVWILVAAALLVRIGVGAVRAHRFARRSTPVSDARIQREFARARAALGIDCDVDLTTSWDVAVPVVVGVQCPRVILPASATSWPAERLRVVFLHELAHVRRSDAAWLMFARGVTAVLWFHPLVWALSLQVRREAERACDDIVLATGVRGSDYAGHLVSLARSVAVPSAVPALAFATPSSLERRIASILSARRPGARVSPRTLGSLAVAATLVIASIAMVRPVAVESAVAHPAHKSKTTKTRTKTSTFTTTGNYVWNQGNGNVNYVAGNRDSKGESAYDRAQDLYNKGRWSRSAEAYMEAAKLGFRAETAYYNAGCSYALADKPGEAVDALRAALDEGFDNTEIFSEDDDLNSLRADPRFKKLMDEVMSSDTAQRKQRAAGRRFEQLGKRSDVEDGEWNAVGISLMRSGDTARAATAFQNEFKVSQDNDAIYNEACAAALAGKSDAALTLLEKSIKNGDVSADHMEEDPDLVSLHDQARFNTLVALAEDLSLWGNYSSGNWSTNWSGKWNSESSWRKRLPHYQKVANDRADIGRAWFNLGYAQLQAEDPAKSSASFQKALDLGYQQGTTMYNLACCAAQMDQADKAIDWLTKAEKAGMDVGSRAWWDDDLSPLRSDKRFKEMHRKWKADEKNDWSWNHDDHDDHEDDRESD